MHLGRHLVTPLMIAVAAWPADAGQAPAAAPALTPERMATFLTTAKITRLRDAGNGVTGSRRATLSDGTWTHDAHIQTVDIERTRFEAGKVVELNFKDLARYNITAYRLATVLGLDNVPVSVERVVDSKVAAVTWWVDDVKMDEKTRLKEKTAGPDPTRTSHYIQLMRVFDELIANRDRNQGNILWTSDWKMWLIDHTRAFRLETGLARPDNLSHCDRDLFARLRTLTRASLEAALGRFATGSELSALLARRDAIVRHLDQRIALVGEASVLYTMER